MFLQVQTCIHACVCVTIMIDWVVREDQSGDAIKIKCDLVTNMDHLPPSLAASLHAHQYYAQINVSSVK